MRREWSGLIRERNWKEFERLAKTDPSQPLTDTVAELERGFPEKADRKALRKVLFFLGQAGYKPTEIEEATAPSPEPTPELSEFAYFAVPNVEGISTLIYARPSDKGYRLLQCSLTGRGIAKALEREVPEEEKQNFDAIVKKSVHAFAAVPPEFALWRLGHAIQLAKAPLPPEIAYWRIHIDRAPQGDHPAKSLPRREATFEDEQAARETTPVGYWYPEITRSMQIAGKYFAEDAERTLTGGQIENQSRSFIEEAGPLILGPEEIQDHTLRLLDLGYLMSRWNDKLSPVVLWYADDLRQQGLESVYARMMLERVRLRFVSILTNPRKETGPSAVPDGE